MKKQILKLFFILALFLIMPNLAIAEVVFEDDFDAQPDWHPNCIVCGINESSVNGGYLGTMPSGWPYFRNDEYWNQYMTAPYGSYVAVPESQPTIQIKGGLHIHHQVKL